MADIIKANDQDLDSVLSLLEVVNLPTEGVVDNFHNFFVAWESNQIMGCAGIEIYENIGLIRSVAVHPASQGRGLGRKLVNTIHRFSVERGLNEIYLLTETAETFFLRLNYVVIPREEADEKVKRSAEFTSLCPVSAICMLKTLT